MTAPQWLRSAAYVLGLARDACALCGSAALPRARGRLWLPETICNGCLVKAFERAVPEVWYAPAPMVTMAGTDLDITPGSMPRRIAMREIESAVAKVCAPRLLIVADGSSGDLSIRDLVQPCHIVLPLGELWEPPELTVRFYEHGARLEFRAHYHGSVSTLAARAPASGDLYGEPLLDEVAQWLVRRRMVQSARRWSATQVDAVTHAGERVHWVLAGCGPARRFAALRGDFTFTPILRRRWAL